MNAILKGFLCLLLGAAAGAGATALLIVKPMEDRARAETQAQLSQIAALTAQLDAAKADAATAKEASQERVTKIKLTKKEAEAASQSTSQKLAAAQSDLAVAAARATAAEKALADEKSSDAVREKALSQKIDGLTAKLLAASQSRPTVITLAPPSEPPAPSETQQAVGQVVTADVLRHKIAVLQHRIDGMAAARDEWTKHHNTLVAPIPDAISEATAAELQTEEAALQKQLDLALAGMN